MSAEIIDDFLRTARLTDPNIAAIEDIFGVKLSESAMTEAPFGHQYPYSTYTAHLKSQTDFITMELIVGGGTGVIFGATLAEKRLNWSEVQRIGGIDRQPGFNLDGGGRFQTIMYNVGDNGLTFSRKRESTFVHSVTIRFPGKQ